MSRGIPGHKLEQFILLIMTHSSVKRFILLFRLRFIRHWRRSAPRPIDVF